MALDLERFETYGLDNPYPDASLHDSSLIMSSEEITRLKDFLRNDPSELSSVCGELAVRQLTLRQSVREALETEVSPITARSFMLRSGRLAASNASGLSRCLAYPRDMWLPHGFSPPSDFAYVLITTSPTYTDFIRERHLSHG